MNKWLENFVTKGLCSLFFYPSRTTTFDRVPQAPVQHTRWPAGGACTHSQKGSKVLLAEGMGTIILLVTKTAWSLMHGLKLFSPPSLMLHPRESDRGGSPDFINTWINIECDSAAAHSAEEITGLKDRRNSETERQSETWTSRTWILARLHGCQRRAAKPHDELKIKKSQTSKFGKFLNLMKKCATLFWANVLQKNTLQFPL